MRFALVSNKPRHFNHFYPATVAVVGVEQGEKVNFMPVVWHVGLSFDPPLFGVGVSPKRFTFRMLSVATAFSVSFHPYSQAAAIHKLGGVSGREVDKVAAFDLAVIPGRALKVPVLAGAYAAYELEKVDQITTGDHTLFVGRVRGVWEEPAAFAREALNPAQVEPLLYYGRYRYGRPRSEVLDLEDD